MPRGRSAAFPLAEPGVGAGRGQSYRCVPSTAGGCSCPGRGCVTPWQPREPAGAGGRCAELAQVPGVGMGQELQVRGWKPLWLPFAA